MAVLAPWVVLDPLLAGWLREDVGRGDRTTASIYMGNSGCEAAQWIAKAPGVIAGLPVASRIFYLLDPTVKFEALVAEGDGCEPGQVVARLVGAGDTLLLGERVALNLSMRLSGIATLTREYVEKIADLPVQLVDTRKTTPGLRLLEKYATQVAGAVNHRLGLDDAVIETKTLTQVEEALHHGADIIMLDNMSLDLMTPSRAADSRFTAPGQN